MNLLKSVCFFALIFVNKFVLATSCTCDSDEPDIYYDCVCYFDCDEKNYGYTEDKIQILWDTVPDIAKSSISEITFESCSFDKDDGIWQGEWCLTKLTASDNQLYEIPRNLLSSCNEQLDLSNNFITQINSSTFKNVTNLIKLDLSYNSIQYLQEDVFDSLIDLEELNLSYNPIGNLKIGTFAHLEILEILSLKHIKIDSIQSGLFLHQQTLVSLDLSENSLKVLDFEQNSPIFYSLQTLNLSKNELTDLNGFRNEIFPRLTLLDIRDNQFNCSYLQKLFESVDFTEIRMPDDPQMAKEHKTHVRGVKCKDVSILELKNSLHQLQNDMNFLKFSIVFLCIIVFIFLMVFLCRS